jgi:hypothetical protein
LPGDLKIFDADSNVPPAVGFEGNASPDKFFNTDDCQHREATGLESFEKKSSVDEEEGSSSMPILDSHEYVKAKSEKFPVLGCMIARFASAGSWNVTNPPFSVNCPPSIVSAT